MTKPTDVSDDLRTLVGLVENYSPTGHERETAEWLVNYMSSIGYPKSYLDHSGNALGIIGNGPRQILFLGHLDTVPGKIPVKLTENILYGRGAVDAKGPLAAFIDAVVKTGPIPGWQFVVVGAVDEEGDSRGARALVSEFNPDFCIVGEPSQWDRIALGYKGSAQVKIETKKSRSHSARLEGSVCENLLTVWSSIVDWVNEYNQSYDRYFDKIQPSLQGWDSDVDDFTEWASIQISARLPTNFQTDQWFMKIKELAPDRSISKVSFPVPPFLASKNSSLVKSFLHAIRNSGGTPVFVYKTGTSDANIVSESWECPIVVYGPGDSNLDHTPEEHIILNDFYKAVEILEGVIQQISRS